MVHPEVRKKVPNEHVLESVGLAKSNQNADGDREAEITQQNKLGILGFIQGACWVEVVDTGGIAVHLALSTTFKLALVVVVSSHVGEQVHGPSKELLAERVKEGRDWSFFGQLVDFVHKLSNAARVLVSSLWDENHVTFHVPRGLVVLAVGNLPGEVWNEEGRMAEPTSCVVENLRGREGLMTALMSKDPEASPEKTLNDGIESPQCSANWGRRDVLWRNELVEQHEGRCQACDIPSNIAQTSQARSLEAVFGNGVSNIIDTIVWQVKLVPICINELAISLLLCVIQRRH